IHSGRMSCFFPATPKRHFAEGGWGGNLFPPHRLHAFGAAEGVAVVVGGDLGDLVVDGRAVALVDDNRDPDLGPVVDEALGAVREVDASVAGVAGVLRARAPAAALPVGVVEALTRVR